MEFSWAGALCLSRHHVPAFGEVEPGLYAACCENGLGTVKSTLAGMMAAELATNTSSDHLRQYQQQPAPGRLPPEPLTWLGRSEEHTSELQSLMRISYAVFCLNKKNKHNITPYRATD